MNRRSSYWICCGWLLMGTAAEADQLTSAEREMLSAGEVLLENAHMDDRGGSARVHILMNADPEALWGIFMSCEHAFTFIRGLRRCEVLEESRSRAVTRQVVDRGWMTPRQDFTFRTRRTPFSYMEFDLVDGSLDILQGFWMLEPGEEGLLVTHEMWLKPKVPVPRWLVRRTIRSGMPEMMRCIRGLAEQASGLTPDAEDLEQCPQAPAFP